MSVIFTPLERLIHILSNGVTNSIFFGQTTYFVRTRHIWCTTEQRVDGVQQNRGQTLYNRTKSRHCTIKNRVDATGWCTTEDR